ncbi:hypothetical protein ACJX0J_025193, partial [Zea mays]
ENKKKCGRAFGLSDIQIPNLFNLICLHKLYFQIQSIIFLIYFRNICLRYKNQQSLIFAITYMDSNFYFHFHHDMKMETSFEQD